MNQDVKQGLGLLCVAVICLVIGLALRTGSEEFSTVRDIGALIGWGAALVGLGGLALMARGLLRAD